jgi:AcrR family transcriptional regulator
MVTLLPNSPRSAAEPSVLPQDTAVAQPTTSRGRRTRNALVHAAREVFEELGFHDTKIADIPRRAGVSHGTFYTYFDSKHAIFREVVNAAMGDLFQATRSGLGEGGSPVERIRAANTRYFASYARNAGVLRAIEEASFRDPYFHDLLAQIRAMFVDRITIGIQRLQEQGLADCKLDAERAATSLGGMAEQAARHAFLFGGSFVEELTVDTITRVWARGIGLNFDRPD